MVGLRLRNLSPDIHCDDPDSWDSQHDSPGAHGGHLRQCQRGPNFRYQYRHLRHFHRSRYGLTLGSVIETGWGEAVSAVSSKEVWTITSVEWAAIQAKITPAAAPTPTSAILLKGLTTQALDSTTIY